MPFFLILLASGIGFFAGVEAISDAEEKKNRAQSILRDAETRYKQTAEELQSKMEELMKIANEFNNVSKEFMDKITKELPTNKPVKEINYDYINLETIATVGITSTVGAALVPAALMSIASTIGVASTGTAISALSGAAAENAALAWLGGGALEAGGLGIAGGMFALGAAALGVGTLIAGLTYNDSASDYLAEASRVARQANEEIQKMRIDIQTTIEKTNKLKLLNDTLMRLYNIYQTKTKDNQKLSNIIKDKLEEILENALHWIQEHNYEELEDIINKMLPSS